MALLFAATSFDIVTLIVVLLITTDPFPVERGWDIMCPGIVANPPLDTP